MLKQEDNESDHPRRAGHADGQLDARVLGARHALLRAATARLRPGAGDAAGRAADRLPRHPRQGRPDPEPLPAPRRVAVLRPQRRSGLRCVYHGWKFDVDGNCIDMPNEPAESNFKTKVKATAYPTQERGGIVWTYMGPRATPPPLPDLEANMLPEGEYAERRPLLRVQLAADPRGRHRHEPRRLPALGGPTPEEPAPGTFSRLPARQKPRPLRGHRHTGRRGLRRARPGPPGEYYWRVAQFCLPFFTFTPPGVLGIKKNNGARVPMDDTRTMSFFMNVGGRRPANGVSGPVVFPTYSTQHLGLVRTLPLRDQ